MASLLLRLVSRFEPVFINPRLVTKVETQLWSARAVIHHAGCGPTFVDEDAESVVKKIEDWRRLQDARRPRQQSPATLTRIL